MFPNGSGSPRNLFPTGPGGMLLGEGSFGGRRGSKRWAAAAQHISAAEVVGGLLFFFLSLRYLYQFTEFTGLALGALAVAAGLLGYFGSRGRSANIVNAQLIASIIGIMLAFQLIGEVSRDRQIDCALAELYHRGKATERAVASARQAEAMHSVFSRLSEMEDMLSLVQQGAAHSVQLKQEQNSLKWTDLNYIKAKVEMVRHHAQDVLDSVLKNPNITSEHIAAMSEEDKDFLRRRLDTADKVLERITRAHSDPAAELSYEEYGELLAALTDAAVAPERAAHPELAAAKAELPNMRAALERAKADAYHTLQVGEAPGALRQIQEYRDARRAEWEQQFSEHLQREAVSGDDYLADLPEHCVRETSGERVMVGGALLLVGLLLAGAYTALSLSFRLPVKGE